MYSSKSSFTDIAMTTQGKMIGPVAMMINGTATISNDSYRPDYL